MDRAQILLIGLPLFLFCTDIINIFTPPPPKPPHHHHHHHHPPHHHHHPPHHHHHHHHPPHHHHHHPPHHHPHPPHHHHHHPPHDHHHHHPVPTHLQSSVAPETLDSPSQKEGGVIEGIGLGHTIDISFCSSCSYKGTALTMKKILETAFPGIDVVLANHPPTFPKRLISKLVPAAQIGVVGLVVAGEQIFPMLGFIAPPPWYYSLRANRFGTIATTWLLGNTLQSFLQSTGAFEVYLNNELVFSKLKEGRFPGDAELKGPIGKKLASSRTTDA